MKNILAVILCAWLCLAANAVLAEAGAPASTATPPATATDSATELKLQQQRLDFFKERLDLQDKRIGDLSLYLGLFGAFITVVVIFFSFRSTSEAKLAAKEEARKEIEAQAKRIIEDWLNNDGRKALVDKIDGFLQPEVEKALKKIQETASSILNELETERQKAHEHNQQQERLNQQHKELINELSSRNVDKAAPLSSEKKEQLDAIVTDLRDKPSTQYQYADWHVFALQAYETRNYEKAAEYFDQAAAVAEKPSDWAKALNNKGVTLGQAGKTEEELAAYERVITAYGDAPEAALREQVAKALNGWGFLLLCEAKKHWEEAGEALLGEALEKIDRSLAHKADNAVALGNKGYALFLQGKKQEARAILAEAIRLGGDKLRQGELKDAEIHPLPQDEEFKALINSL